MISPEEKLLRAVFSEPEDREVAVIEDRVEEDKPPRIRIKEGDGNLYIHQTWIELEEHNSIVATRDQAIQLANAILAHLQPNS